MVRHLKIFEGSLNSNEVLLINYQLPKKCNEFELIFIGKGSFMVSFTKNNRKENLINRLNLDFPNNPLIFPIPLNLYDEELTLKRLFENRYSIEFEAQENSFLKGTVKNTSLATNQFLLYLKAKNIRK
jgi:hypothetical protein